jgi:NAD(P)-dependent dehydrogenase (short-subunit alcohol dehydrogenase family)
MTSGLAGKVIAITGAGGGIGAATCERLVDHGDTVYALDLRPSPHGTPITTDVTDSASVDAAVARIVAEQGHIDGMVAGAGMVEDNVPAEEMDATQFDRILAVNLRSTAGRQPADRSWPYWPTSATTTSRSFVGSATASRSSPTAATSSSTRT